MPNSKWNQLINYLGGFMVAGGNVKEAGFAHWLSPNKGATNCSGFTSLPAGVHTYNGNCTLLESGTDNFTSSSNLHDVVIPAIDASILFNSILAQYLYWGKSIRCVND